MSKIFILAAIRIIKNQHDVTYCLDEVGEKAKRTHKAFQVKHLMPNLFC